jgi:transposase
MEQMHTIPTPPTLRKETSRDERLRAYTLYFDAGFTQAEIALQLNLTSRQVQYALAYRITPQKQMTGRKVLLNTPQRKRLIEWVTASKENRRVA